MRDNNLVSLRPDLGLDTADLGACEQFQNQTLRPILKLQHPILLNVFRHYVGKRKNAYRGLSKEKRLAYIEQSVRNDVALKNRLIGVAIGHFTEAEWRIFLENEPELTRRLSNLTVQRLQSEADTFAL